jgi:CubicO group peptidase (beta-lactamase class C family)
MLATHRLLEELLMIRVRRTFRFIVPAVCLVALAGPPLAAQGLPAASPESVGLSSDRLERIDRVMREYVDEGRVAGTVALVARRGKIAHLQAYGQRDLEKHAPMQRDAIFASRRCPRPSRASRP